MAILYSIVQFTKMGKAMRAVSEDKDTAALMGIDVNRIIVTTFAVGAAMGLAPVLVELIFDTIKKINEEGVTILLVEQNALMALSIAHRGYVLQTGEIVLSDTTENLKKNPTVQKAYLGME